LKNQINQAIALRREGKKQESNHLLKELVKEFPEDPIVHYQCAWSYDLLGMEREAIPCYERAIELGLSGDDLEGALLGLGSSYRALGEYEKSKAVFLKGIEQFPNNRALQVFYSMVLYNLKEHDSAMETLLKCLIDTTEDEQILHYKRAIQFYSDKLDTIWS
jgi:tetratricopeptide (TPR) repeat protein